MAALDPYDTAITAERSQVIVDLGSADGLQPGNTFTIIRQADPLEQFVDPAAEVKEHASTCMLLKSAREIVAGDRLVLYAPGKAPVSVR